MRKASGPFRRSRGAARAAPARRQEEAPLRQGRTGRRRSAARLEEPSPAYVARRRERRSASRRAAGTRPAEALPAERRPGPAPTASAPPPQFPPRAAGTASARETPLPRRMGRWDALHGPPQREEAPLRQDRVGRRSEARPLHREARRWERRSAPRRAAGPGPDGARLAFLPLPARRAAGGIAPARPDAPHARRRPAEPSDRHAPRAAQAA